MGDRRLSKTSPYSGTFDGALKHHYEPGIQSLLVEMFPWLDWLKKEKRVNRNPKVRGDQIYFGTTVKRSSGVGIRGEMDTLPTSDAAEIVQGYLPYMRGIKGRIAISAETMRLGRQGKGSFVDIVQHEMDEIMNGAKEDASSAAWGAGNGILAKVPDHSGGGTTVTITSSEKSTECYPGTRWLHEGKKIMPVTNTDYDGDATWDTAGEVTDITSDTSIEIAATKTAAGTDRYLVGNESASNGAVTIEPAGGSAGAGAGSYTGPSGFLAMVDDGTFASSYENISESTYPRWKAQIIENSGTLRSLTLSLFYQAFFKTVRKTGSIKPNLVGWTNFDVLIKLVDLLDNYVEFAPRKLEAGFEEVDVMINGKIIKLKLDPYCPTYIFLMDPGAIDFYETIPMEFATEHGSEWFPLANQDGYEARIRWNFQIGTKARNRHACIMDLNVPIVTM